jgi:polysaccharide deacetylase family protein (PEP-CTERM system associated)
MPVTVTFDLEDNRRSDQQEERFVPMSHRFLDFLEERGITATVFVVGEIARSHPDLVRRVAASGHEIGLHGLRHAPIGAVGPASLPGELRDGRSLLEDIAQASVLGFRAPIFSLTPSTKWAVDHIADAGFAYSSSLLPATNPLHGWPGAPNRPCRWDNGLLELPCPVGGAGPLQIPFLGGIYLRVVPTPLVRRFLGSLDAAAIPWTYSHPYDLDTEEPFFVMPYTAWLTSRILHTRRAATLTRLSYVIRAAEGSGPPLLEIATGLAQTNLPRIPSA